jgi:hypothetical protein
MIKKEEIYTNAIYQHWKGDYYRVTEVAYHHELGDLEGVVIYYKCNVNGIFKSIRGLNHKQEEEIVKQPFYRKVKEFMEKVRIGGYPNEPVERFKFIKQL